MITPQRSRFSSGYQVTGADELNRIRSRYRTQTQTNDFGLYSDASGSEIASAEGRAAYGLPPITRSTTTPTGALGDPSSAGDATPPSALDTAPRAAMPAGTTPPPGNAAQRWQPDALPDWMAMGGSQRTFNRANVARGVRPAIDARSNPSPLNSNASDQIRAQWAQKTPSWTAY